VYRRIIPLDERLTAGRLRLVGDDALVGMELAHDLGLQVGDRLRLAADAQTVRTFAVAGIFDLGNKDINQRWVFVPLRAAQAMLAMPGAVSTIEVRIDHPWDAEQTATAIASRTGLTADSWMALNRQLLVALRSQSSSSYMIQFFVMLAVALGIASVLVVSVVQKSREIGILKAAGTSTGRIIRIFLFQGGAVGLTGAVGGCALGTGLSLLFASLAQNPDGSPTFPVDLNAGLYLRSVAIATVIGILAAVVPARRAANLDPATVIRYG
jgi:lipoprotein-releasing system permease protein